MIEKAATGAAPGAGTAVGAACGIEPASICLFSEANCMLAWVTSGEESSGTAGNRPSLRATCRAQLRARSGLAAGGARAWWSELRRWLRELPRCVNGPLNLVLGVPGVDGYWFTPYIARHLPVAGRREWRSDGARRQEGRDHRHGGNRCTVRAAPRRPCAATLVFQRTPSSIDVRSDSETDETWFRGGARLATETHGQLQRLDLGRHHRRRPRKRRLDGDHPQSARTAAG